MPRNRSQKPVQGRKGKKRPNGRTRAIIERTQRFREGRHMPTVAELMNDTAPMRVQCELGEINVEYRPRVITPAWQRSVTDKEESGADETETLFQPLRDCLRSWDLYKSPGMPYEMTDEDLREIPRQILNQILWSLMTTARPNPDRPPVLSAASSPAPTILPARMTGKSAPETRTS